MELLNIFRKHVAGFFFVTNCYFFMNVSLYTDMIQRMTAICSNPVWDIFVTLAPFLKYPCRCTC